MNMMNSSGSKTYGMFYIFAMGFMRLLVVFLAFLSIPLMIAYATDWIANDYMREIGIIPIDFVRASDGAGAINFIFFILVIFRGPGLILAPFFIFRSVFAAAGVAVTGLFLINLKDLGYTFAELQGLILLFSVFLALCVFHAWMRKRAVSAGLGEYYKIIDNRRNTK
jgi:hypothetical protein